MQKDININKIGFIGLGVMGMSMFKNLANCKELSLQGFDNDNAKLSTLKKMQLKQASNIEQTSSNKIRGARNRKGDRNFVCSLSFLVSRAPENDDFLFCLNKM